MEREQYSIMARREERHWWYAGMRRVALAVLERALDGRSGLRILDAGCGTGGTTVELHRFGEVVGVDLAWAALEPARSRGLSGLARASIECLPFGSATFDVATSFEVVYHLGVASDAAAAGSGERALSRNMLVARNGDNRLRHSPIATVSWVDRYSLSSAKRDVSKNRRGR